MSGRVRWTVPALQALTDLQDYIAADNPRAALALAQHIQLAVSQLATHPRLGREGRVQGTRELLIPGTPYIVPYRVKDDEIHILSVYHGARKWPDDFPKR